MLRSTKLRQLVEKRQKAHGLRAILGVHQHAMPLTQHHRFVVGVPDLATHVHRRITPHHSKVATLAFCFRQSAVFLGGQARGIRSRNVDGFSTRPIAFLSQVCFPSISASEWLIAKNEQRVGLDAGRRNEKPFPLAGQRLRSCAGNSLSAKFQADLLASGFLLASARSSRPRRCSRVHFLELLPQTSAARHDRTETSAWPETAPARRIDG